MDRPIKMPDREQRLYTQMDFEQAMERADADTKLAMQQEEARGCGFVFLYFHLLHGMMNAKQFSKMHQLIGTVNQGARTLDGAKRLCDSVNAVQRSLRNQLGQAMQAYIRHKGYIDAWPCPGNTEGISLHGFQDGEKTEAVKIPFGFFNRPFVAKEDGNRIVIYRNPWTKKLYESGVPGPEELVKRDERLKALRAVRKPTQKQRIVSNLKMIGSWVPFMLMAFFAAALAFWYLTGTQKPLNTLGAGAPSGRFMAAAMLPANVLLMFPAAFYPFLSLHPAVLWGSVIALLVTGVFASAMIASALNAVWISKKTLLKGIRAAEEIERLENDERYAQMEKEYRERVREDEAFAECWIEEWKAACKQNNLYI